MFKVLGAILLLCIASGCGGSSETPTPQKELKYTVSTSASAGGTISPASTTVLTGNSTSFELAVSTGFKIKSVSGCGGVVNGITYTTGVISSNCTVNAEFEKLSYLVNVNVTGSGMVEPASKVVEHGSTAEFAVTPAVGAKVTEVTSNCGAVITNNHLKSDEIFGNCTINVKFEKLSYQVNVNITGSGTVEPASKVVEHGSSAEFVVTPAEHFTVSAVTSNCGAAMTNNKLRTEAIMDNCMINVKFDTMAYEVTAVASKGGSISPAKQSVPYGSKAQFSVVEDEGYKVKNISGCDGALHGMTYTTSAISAACQVDVTFNGLPNARFNYDSFVYLGLNADFDASPSNDPDGDLITYQWSLESKPTGSTATIVSDGANSPSATLTPDVEGIYDVGLVVNDGTHNSVKTIHQLRASDFNLEPTAVIRGPTQGKVGELYVADGLQSHDPDNDSLTYEWTVRGAAAPATIDDSTPGYLKLIPTQSGTLIVDLRVKDSAGWYSTSELLVVDILAATENRAPIADAGETQMARINTAVQLDGVNSFDRDGDTLTYQWQFVSKPAGSVVELQNEHQQQSQFVPDVAGTYVVELVVSDGIDTGSDNVTILVDEPSVKLYFKDTEIGYYNPIDFPMFNRSFLRMQIVGKNQVDLITYKMTADGKDFVIENVKAVDTTGTVVPQIVGLTEGMTLKAGESVEFTLVSPLTNGATVELEYTFNIKGNNQTFVNKIQLTTN